MATLTATPSSVKKGDNVVLAGAGFLAATVCRVTLPELGISSEITSDTNGDFGTTDIADHAAITLTSDATNVTADDTVTIGTRTYTFKASVTTTADEVKIGASAAATLANLKKAINLTGVAGTDYGSLTTIHATVSATTITATTLVLIAKTGGTAGNSLTSTEASTHLSFPGATFNSGTPGSAATGTDALLINPERVGTFVATATDGTSTATCSVQVSTA